MKIIAITQARVGSTRFPEKILKTINEKSLLEIHLQRILNSKLITKVKVATTTEKDSYKIISIAKKCNVATYTGSIDNVLERFYYAAKPENPNWIVRLTSDCPLIDPSEIDKVIQFAITNNIDYASNTLTPTYPDGIDVEVFKFSVLKKAYKEAKLKSDIEHVTPYIWKNSTYMGKKLFTSNCIINKKNYSNIRITVDTIEDFIVIKKLIDLIGENKSWIEYVKVLENSPKIAEINKKFRRNQGYLSDTRI